MLGPSCGTIKYLAPGTEHLGPSVRLFFSQELPRLRFEDPYPYYDARPASVHIPHPHDAPVFAGPVEDHGAGGCGSHDAVARSGAGLPSGGATLNPDTALTWGRELPRWDAEGHRSARAGSAVRYDDGSGGAARGCQAGEDQGATDRDASHESSLRSGSSMQFDRYKSTLCAPVIQESSSPKGVRSEE